MASYKRPGRVRPASGGSRSDPGKEPQASSPRHAALRRAELEVRVGAPGERAAAFDDAHCLPEAHLGVFLDESDGITAALAPKAVPAPGHAPRKMGGEARPLPGGVSGPGVRRERAVAAPLVPYLGPGSGTATPARRSTAGSGLRAKTASTSTEAITPPPSVGATVSAGNG